jgi:hypothetical protein
MKTEPISAIRRAGKQVQSTARRVDPGHIPFIAYLEALAKQLNQMADHLEKMMDRESGA